MGHPLYYYILAGNQTQKKQLAMKLLTVMMRDVYEKKLLYSFFKVLSNVLIMVGYICKKDIC